MKIIEVKGLQKNYNELQAVKGIDFIINKGEFVALLGPNGGEYTPRRKVATHNGGDTLHHSISLPKISNYWTK